MKLLVTGCEGQLARSLVERAAAWPGLEVVAIGRPGLDLEQPGSAERAIAAAAPALVINAAAYTAVDQAEDEPERAFQINAAAAGEVAAAAHRIQVPVVQISTDYVFDGCSEQPYSEDAPTHPLGVYGKSKLEGEQRVRDANPDHVIVRTAWVYSPFGRNFLKTMRALGQTRDRVAVVADQRGNPSSALDLADGLLAMAESWSRGGRAGLGETYHLTGSGIASWFDFASAIFGELRQLGAPAADVDPIRTADWPTKAPRPLYSALDSSKFTKDFAFRMPAWRQSMRRTIARLAAGADIDNPPLARS